MSLAELLEANVGETIDVRLTGDKVVRGTIVAVPPNRPASPAVMPTRSALCPTALSPGVIATGETATLVLQTDSGMVALNKSSVEQITRVGALRISIDRKTRAPALSLRATNPRGDGRVAIHYLAPSPSGRSSRSIGSATPRASSARAIRCSPSGGSSRS